MGHETKRQSPRQIRRALRLPLIYVAAAVHSSEGTARVYEADPEAVSPAKRQDFDRYYAQLETKLRDSRSAGDGRLGR
jgi:hypothetical protein